MFKKMVQLIIIMSQYVLPQSNIIKLTEPNDLIFSQIAQKATVTGATLPSGLKISPFGDWKIIDSCIVNIGYLTNDKPLKTNKNKVYTN